MARTTDLLKFLHEISPTTTYTATQRRLDRSKDKPRIHHLFTIVRSLKRKDAPNLDAIGACKAFIRLHLPATNLLATMR
eukprot:6213669-Pleurochrysis_carterae.AAC.2